MAGRTPSDIDTRTGSGALTGGGFAVVINLDNTTDSPEFVVMTGGFQGSMQVVADTTVNPPKPLPLINLSNGTFMPTAVFGVPIEHPITLGRQLAALRMSEIKAG